MTTKQKHYEQEVGGDDGDIKYVVNYMIIPIMQRILLRHFMPSRLLRVHISVFPCHAEDIFYIVPAGESYTETAFSSATFSLPWFTTYEHSR